MRHPLRAWSRPFAACLIATLACLGCGSSKDEVSADAVGQDAGSQEPDGSEGVDAQVEAGTDAAPEAAPEASPEAGPPQLPNDADATRIAAWLKVLASEEYGGRRSGTPFGTKTEDYLIAELTKTGIEVQTSDITFPGFAIEGPAAMELLDESGTVTESLAYVKDFREVEFSGSGNVTGQLAFVGYGLVQGDIDSYAGVDATGKIVAILTDVPPGKGLDPVEDGRLDRKIDLARDHGAAGVIFIPAGTDKTYDVQLGDEMQLVALDGLDYDPTLRDENMPVAFVHVSATKKLTGFDQKELTQKTAFDTGRKVRLEIHGKADEKAQCRNVYGLIRGESPEVVILGAHHDHIGIGADGRLFPGASDNGSGTVVVLETAASLAAVQAKPKRNLLFAFWCGEEQIFRGSLDYSVFGGAILPINDTKLMVQVDYIGEEDGPYVTNLDDNALMALFLGDEQKAAELPVTAVDWDGQSASDDYGFLYKKIPAYRFLSYGAHHHQSSDTFENASMPMIKRVADVTIRGMGAVGYRSLAR